MRRVVRDLFKDTMSVDVGDEIHETRKGKQYHAAMVSMESSGCTTHCLFTAKQLRRLAKAFLEAAETLDVMEVHRL